MIDPDKGDNTNKQDLNPLNITHGNDRYCVLKL